MIVSELIEALQKLPPTLKIMVISHGCEYDYLILESVRVENMEFHDTPHDPGEDPNEPHSEDVVVLEEGE